MSDEVKATAASPMTMTSSMLRALAHPVRRRVLFLLESRGPMRAADLSERLDLPANQISFHLRSLAKAGMIEDAPELARDRRDRVWRAVSENFILAGPVASPEDKLAATALLSQVAADLKHLIDRAVRYVPEHGEGAPRDPKVSLSFGYLTTDQLERVQERLSELLEDEARSADDAPERRLWEYSFVAVRDDLPN